MRKKRSFFLLEVLIALSVIALCAVPLVRAPSLFYRIQIQALRDLELQRIADWSFSEVKDQLLAHQIPWKELPQKKKPPLTFSLPPFLLELPFFPSKIISRSCQLSCRAEKEGPKGEIFRLYDLLIEFPDFNQSTYTYRILIQKTG